MIMIDVEPNPPADHFVSAVPALDIEEILDQRPWEKRDLTPREKQLLMEGIAFLELVQLDRQIIVTTATDGVVEYNPGALEAYNLLAQAYQTTPHEEDYSVGLAKETEDILVRILEGTINKIDAETDEEIAQAQLLINKQLDRVRLLFLSLAKLGISSLR